MKASWVVESHGHEYKQRRTFKRGILKTLPRRNLNVFVSPPLSCALLALIFLSLLFCAFLLSCLLFLLFAVFGASVPKVPPKKN